MGSRQTDAVLDNVPQAVLDLLPLPVFVTGIPDGTIFRRNARAVDLHGGTAPVHERLTDLLQGLGTDGTPLPPAADPIAAALAGGTPVDDVDALLATAGHPVPVTASIVPLHSGDASPVAALVTCQPAVRWQETHRAVAALRRSEQRLTLALAAGRLGSWEFNPLTRELTASAQCKANHGLAPDADLGIETALIPAIHADHRERFRAALQRAIAEEGSFEIELPIVWPDRTEHWLLIAGRLIEPACMVGVSLDQTGRRGTDEALIEADRRKDEFLTTVVHELRAPLAPILAAARILQLKGPADPALQKPLDTIIRQGQQLATLVDDLLDVGRMSAGKLQIERSRVELNAIVREAVETCAPLIERRQHTLHLALTGEPVFLEADGGRLVQVVCNLLNNAAKYMRDGGRIDVWSARDGGTGVIRIRDEGVGIAPEMLGQIFERFVQVGTSRHRADGGLGIGLSLVRAVVEMHGGTVEAQSDGIGTGSVFTVRLPATAAP